jgi:tetratricopeptide (TPR) repeat protein
MRRAKGVVIGIAGILSGIATLWWALQGTTRSPSVGRGRDTTLRSASATAAEASSKRGLAFSTEGRWKEALPNFEEAARLEPENADYQFYSALALGNLDRTAEALRDLDRAIALRPKDVKQHYFRALALYGLRRRDEAIAEVDNTLSLDPNDQEALQLRHLLGPDAP